MLFFGAIVFSNGRVALVTFKAPAHRELADTAGYRHVILDFPVTLLAENAGFDVSLVREIHEVRKVVNFDPWDLFLFVELAPKVLDVFLCGLGTILYRHLSI